MPDRPLRLVISGASGRMGRAVATLAAAANDVEVTGGIDKEGGHELEGVPTTVAPEDAESVLREADVVIDFSAPEFLRNLIQTQRTALQTVALISGTTGLGPAEEEALESLGRDTAVLTAANFSVGVNLLSVLVEEAAAALGEDFDIEIVETHHRRKEDAPSGTALALGAAAAKGRGVRLAEVRQDSRSGRPGARPAGEIGFHALRGGDVIGDHSVHFIGDVERIELSHRASDRSLFAAGALRAGRWMAGREPGVYTMRQVLGL